MPVIIKQLTGQMDTDAPNETIGPKSYREAWNGRFNGPKGNERFESIDGNRLLPLQDTLTGTDELTIGRYYDSVNARTFFFNFSNSGNHGIYIYNTLTGIFQTLIRVTPTTDILNFTTTPVGDIGIIYGDPQEGDLLCFLDSLGRPTKMNINRYLANTYGTPKRSYINVIKAPPPNPPRCVYENDFTVTNNNLLNSLFKFAYSWVYDDNEWSVLSSAAEQVYPVNPFSPVSTVPKTSDSRIGVFLNTGPENVKKLRIYMKQIQNGATSDWLLVDVIDKSGMLNNVVYKYLFYNSGNYTPEDIAYTSLLFDYVPDVAACQAILNGNVLAYGDITEGYDWFKPTFSYALEASNPGSQINGFLFFASFNGFFTGTQPDFRIVIGGAGTNDSSGNPLTVTNFPADLYFNAISDTTDVSFHASNASGNIHTILSNVQTAAVAAGWVVQGSDVNSLTISYPTGNVLLKSTYYTWNTNFASASPVSSFYPGCNYSMGIVYFDANGKTNGVITDVTANFATYQMYATTFNTLNLFPTYIKLNLNGIVPPWWAVRYAVVRTDNLTYSKYLNWVSAVTYAGVGQTSAQMFAYLDISNIDILNEDAAQEGADSSTLPVQYSFEQGDRVSINGLVNLANGTITGGLPFDYSILGLEINPIINGLQTQGRFIKINYPAADVAANSGVLGFGTAKFANFQMQIYHIASNTQPQTENSGTDEALGNVYYEIGYNFDIGNPGLNTAYHFGNAGDNQIEVQDGDVFYRTRTVPIKNTYQLSAAASAFSNRYVTLGIATSTGAAITVPGTYTVSSQSPLAANPSSATVYPRFSDGGGIYMNTSAVPFNARLYGSFQWNADGQTWTDILVKITGPGGQVLTPYLVYHSDGLAINTSGTITFDQEFTVPAGYKVWLINGNGEQVTNLHMNGWIINMDIIGSVTIVCFDKSYSDTYNLITNSDNRPDVAQPDQKRLEYTTLYRWGQQDQLNTSLNGMNRFYFTDCDEALKMYGPIMKMSVLGKLLYIFQYRKCGTVGVYQKWIKTNSGSDQLIVNDTIIEKNNIRYEVYAGGCGNQPGSIVISNFAHYFADPVKGYICRWSNDGVVLISLLYRAQTWAGQNLPNYLSGQYQYQFGGNARIQGTFKIVDDNNALYLLMAQAGVDSNGDSIDGRVVVFDESDNAFEGFYNINADCIATAENTMYTWYHGKMYIHDDQSPSRNLFGITYPISVTLIFNEKGVVKKTFQGISYQSNKYFIAPAIGDINTSLINPQTGLQQVSQLIQQDASIYENVRYFAFLRDANSGLNPNFALLEGDFLKGTWLQVKLEYAGEGDTFLFAPYILYSTSSRNF